LPSGGRLLLVAEADPWRIRARIRDGLQLAQWLTVVDMVIIVESEHEQIQSARS